VHRRDRAEPFGTRPFDLGGEPQQQILAAEIAIELDAERQSVTVEPGRHRDAGQPGFVRRHRVPACVAQPVEPRVELLFAQ
jgi:hypothetical protein